MAAISHTSLDTGDLGGFGANPETSWTLPGRYYYDPHVFEEETRKIFRRSWQYVGHVSMVPEPRSYLVREVAGDSIALLRDESGTLVAFHNVCLHRAHRLLEGEGRISAGITCPYHAWTYDLGGHLKNARGTDRVAGFDRSEFCLKQVRTETLCGFVFVNFDPDAPALADTYRGLEEEIRSFSPEPEALQIARRREYSLDANWKNSVENFSECYHCPNGHRSLSDGALDIASYRIAVHDAFHSHRSRDRGERQGYPVDRSGPGRANEFGGWMIWPNLSLEVFPGGNLNIFHHVPVGPEHTVQVVEWYFPETSLSAQERQVVDFMHVVRQEDLPLCESVQRGLHSRGYPQGRFVVDADRTDISEHAVHDFQLKVVRALGYAM